MLFVALQATNSCGAFPTRQARSPREFYENCERNISHTMRAILEWFLDVMAIQGFLVQRSGRSWPRGSASSLHFDSHSLWQPRSIATALMLSDLNSAAFQLRIDNFFAGKFVIQQEVNAVSVRSQTGFVLISTISCRDLKQARCIRRFGGKFSADCWSQL
jgi:hypothetical protein